MKKSTSSAGALALLIAALPVSEARASLTLTQEAIGDGFKLSLFASGFPTVGGVGPLGTATTSSGTIIVFSHGGTQSAMTFNDTDNQTYASALTNKPYARPPNGSALTNAQGIIFGTNQASLTQFRNDGTLVTEFIDRGVALYGLATNPLTGHIISAGSDGTYDIDPMTHAFHKISPITGDGVSITPDGKTIYLAVGSLQPGAGSIVGIDAATGVQTYASDAFGPAAGLAILQSVSLFAGDLVVNRNDGTVDLLDPVTNTLTELANSGSRGDYVGLDQNDGSLLITQSDSIYRLTCSDGGPGTGCGFAPAISLPEPSSILPFGLGLLGLFFVRTRTSLRLGGPREFPTTCP